MRIVIEICLGLLYVSCILISCRYLWNKDSPKLYQDQLKDLKTEKST
jgi:hypothetical protein